MLKLTSLDVHYSIYNITEEHDNFEVHTDLVDDDDFSYAQLKDSVAKVLDLSDISSEDLQHELYGPDIVKSCRKLAMETNQNDG